ncbi:protein of unknown function [Pseudodesulfovibrio piezophilus C1TLV30]|uniref:Uncharacterized protein n=1 Tax=Pseudodesulfovibrio piezophilus (strain DSM 21447 / JCM 15486 / C1TLV30) TaxID=1322246 RepID=M1WWD6_PSEP2|nr:protein of unknown function [Pseudodesulfovibrio piezophilus C1TLV30]
MIFLQRDRPLLPLSAVPFDISLFLPLPNMLKLFRKSLKKHSAQCIKESPPMPVMP